MGKIAHVDTGNELTEVEWDNASTHTIGGSADLNIVRSSIYLVAATDAPAHVIAQSDYSSDNQTGVESAITALAAAAPARTWVATIKLVGTFTFTGDVTVGTYTNIDVTEAVYSGGVFVMGLYSQLISPHGRGTQNKLPNSGYGVWSGSAAADIGTVISVSAHTTGSNTVIATTTNTQGLAVGKLVRFITGDVSLRTCLHTITALTANTSFTFQLEGNAVGAGGGAATCKEATVGGAGAAPWDTITADHWIKTTTLETYRWQDDATHLKDGSFYGVKMVTGTASAEYLTYRITKTINPTELMKYAGKAVVFGISVFTTATFKLGIYDGVTWTWSGNPTSGVITWLEVTKTIGAYANISEFQVTIELQGGSGVIAYVSQPMLDYGSYLGAWNYHPKPDELVHCRAHISPAHLVGATFLAGGDGTSRIFRLEGETDGQIPKGAKALLLAQEGTPGVAGDTLVLFRNDYYDPLTQGIILGGTVAGKVSYGGVSLIQIQPGGTSSAPAEDSLNYRWFGTGNWTLVSIDIVGVQL